MKIGLKIFKPNDIKTIMYIPFGTHVIEYTESYHTIFDTMRLNLTLIQFRFLQSQMSFLLCIILLETWNGN